MVGHGAVVVPVEMTDGGLMVIFGSGLRPPVASSVDPIGNPTRPIVDREPMLGDAVGLDDAAAVVAHVPDADPPAPAPSNNGVGADVPDIAPAEDVPAIAPEGAVIDPPLLEHAVPDVIAPGAEGLAAVGLTPGVASSMAPSGIPVPPTRAPGPIPSGDVRPMRGVVPAPMPTCANAVPLPNKGQTIAAIKTPLMDAFLRFRSSRMSPDPLIDVVLPRPGCD